MSSPHFAYPFRITAAGSAAVVEQDTVEEIATCVQTVLTTTQGERLELTTFGVPPVIFEQSSRIRSDVLIRQVNQWEPRAQLVLDIQPDSIDQLVQHITTYVSTAAAQTSGADPGDLAAAAPESGMGWGFGGWGVEGWGA